MKYEVDGGQVLGVLFLLFIVGAFLITFLCLVFIELIWFLVLNLGLEFGYIKHIIFFLVLAWIIYSYAAYYYTLDIYVNIDEAIYYITRAWSFLIPEKANTLMQLSVKNCSTWVYVTQLSWVNFFLSYKKYLKLFFSFFCFIFYVFGGYLLSIGYLAFFVKVFVSIWTVCYVAYTLFFVGSFVVGLSKGGFNEFLVFYEKSYKKSNLSAFLLFLNLFMSLVSKFFVKSFWYLLLVCFLDFVFFGGILSSGL